MKILMRNEDNPPATRPLLRYIPVLLAFFLGVTMSAVLFILVREWEQDRFNDTWHPGGGLEQVTDGPMWRAWGILGAGLLFTSYTAALVALRTRELSITADLLQDEIDRRRLTEESLYQSRRRIAMAEETLRGEIAEFLHGRIQTRLLIIWHRLGQCEALINGDPAQARTLIQEIRDEVDQTRERDVREASHLLHPSIIRIGLLPALRSLASSFEEYFDISLQVDPKLAELDSLEANQVPETARLTVYRVLEEAITNVSRHAEASAVKISLGLGSGDSVEVSIQDNGRGFPMEGLLRGIGLNSIDDRIEVAGGTWEISSQVGQGTTLRASIPLQLPDRVPGY